MNNGIWQSIVKWIARRLKLDVAQKTTQQNDFYDIDNFSPDAIVSEAVANITLADSTLNVEGTNARAELMQTVADSLYNRHLKKACTVALGTGSALIKPNTDGERFGFDIIPEDSYEITGYIGDYIYSVIIKVGAYKTETSDYILAEAQEIKTDNKGMKYLEIRYLTFKDGEPCPLEETRWKDYTDKNISNVDRLLFGRMVCPTTNRADLNSPCGVPITFGAVEQKDNVKDTYRRYQREFKDKEPFIFASKNVFKKNKNGEAVIPEGKERVFMNTSSRSVDGNGIDIYAPNYQETPLGMALEQNFRVLEQSIGLGEGVLTKPTATYENMDRVRASKQATYSFVLAFRRSIDDAIKDMAYAIDILANANNITPMGDYEIYMTWSDQYMSSTSERFTQYLQGNDRSIVSDAELRVILTGEDIDEARKTVEEIKAEKGSIDDPFLKGDDE